MKRLFILSIAAVIFFTPSFQRGGLSLDLPKSYLATTSIFDWNQILEDQHKELKNFTGLFFIGRHMKKRVRDNLAQIESAFHNLIPKEFTFKKKREITTDFVYSLLALKKPELFFDEELTSTIVALQNGAIPEQEQITRFWYSYKTSIQDLISAIGQKSTDVLITRLFKEHSARRNHIFIKLNYFKKLYHLFHTYLGQTKATSELQKAIISASFKMSYNFIPSENIKKANNILEKNLDERVRNWDLNLQRQWLVAISVIASQRNPGIKRLEEIISLFQRHIGEIKERNKEIQRQWLAAIYSIGIYGERGIATVKENISNNPLKKNPTDKEIIAWIQQIYVPATKNRTEAHHIIPSSDPKKRPKLSLKKTDKTITLPVRASKTITIEGPLTTRSIHVAPQSTVTITISYSNGMLQTSL